MTSEFHTRIISFWNGALQTFSEQAVSHLSIPHQTKQFLASVGLPHSIELVLLTFYTDSPKLQTLRHAGSKFLVIGDDYGTKLCIKEGTGELVSIDDVGELPFRYINSRIDVFLVFLEIYLTAQQSRKDTTKAEARALAARLRDEFLLLDPPALDNPENWWSVIVEQVEAELL
jgi:hypothetical protein